MKRVKTKIIVVLILLSVIFIPTGIRCAFFPLFDDHFSRVLYDRNGRLLCATTSEHGQWMFPPQGGIPEKFKQAVVAFEDKRFFRHFGIDLLAVARAARSNLSSSKVVSGASTLTMQTIRMSRNKTDRTLSEKIIEVWYAFGLELSHSKTEILELYAAHAPFGGNVIGIEAAAQRYFGRKSGELSWAEASMLAVLPNSPALIHLKRNRTKLLEKRNLLLKKLFDRHIITETEYSLALWEPLPETVVDFPQYAYHLATQLQGPSTLDRTIQKRTEEIADRYASEYAANFIHNIAVVVARTDNGEILAYVGNTPSLRNRRNGYVDVAAAPRSTGSILKPVLYAAMMSDGQLLPNTLISDTPLNINGFMPHNYNRTYNGVVTASDAVRHSLNVPLVRMVNEYGIGRFKVLLQKLGLTTLPYAEDHYGSTIILGGAEGKLTEITGMYAALARMLMQYEKEGESDYTKAIYPLTSTSGNDSSKRTEPKPNVPLRPSALWYMFDCMCGVNRPEEEAAWQAFSSSYRVAWKTGTSYGGRDAWAVGVTPGFTVGVWVGNADGQGRSSLTGVGYAAPVLFDIFSQLPRSGWFTMPYNDLKKEPICRKSGHIAGPYCEQADSLYIPLPGKSTRICPYHKQIFVGKKGQSDNGKATNYFVLSPAQEWYYARINPDYKPVPEEYLAGGNNDPIEMIYPEWGTSVIIPRGRDGKPEKVVFRCAHSRPEAVLYWHIDDEYVTSTQGEHSLAVCPAPGTHYLTLVDEYGNRKSTLFHVKNPYKK